MPKSIPAILYTALFFIFIKPLQVHSQNSNHCSSHISIVRLVSELERGNNIKIFYNPSWLSSDSVCINTLYLPLNEALSAISENSKLDILRLDSYYIIIPRESQPQIFEKEETSIAIIGNPNEFGRYSKASITGKILDGKTSEPLIGAIVYVENLEIGSSTDVNGNYSLELPVGEHNLRLSYMGYEVNFKKIKLVSPGELNLDLFEESHQLEGVTVFAQRADQNVTQTQMSVVKLDSKALQKLPTTLGEKDIIKSVTLLPGVQTVGEFGTGFNVRGGSADQNLILIEGIPLFNTSHLFGLTSIVNPDLVKGVTLIKAGIPAKFGERAASVMDIRLGSDANKKISVKGGIGLINSRLSLDIPFVNARGYAILGGRSSYSNWLLHSIPDEDLMNSSANFFDVSGQVFIPLGNRYSVSAFGYLSNDGFSYSHDQDFRYSSVLSSVKINAIHNQTTTSNLLFGVSSYSYLLSDLSVKNPLNSYNLESKVDYYTTRWNLSSFLSTRYIIEAGVSGNLYIVNPGEVNPAGETSTVSPKQTQHDKAAELAAFVSNTINITNNFSADIGVRFAQYFKLGPGTQYIYSENEPLAPAEITDSISYAGNKIMASYSGFEPRVNLRYQLSQTSSLKVSYNRIFQFISQVSNTSIATPADVWYLSNKYIKPLESNQLAIGIFKNFSNNEIESSVEVYFKNQRNIVETKNNAQILMNPFLETDLLNVLGKSYGVELYVKRNAKVLSGWLSYTYSRAIQKTNSPFQEEQINSNQYFAANTDKPHSLVVNTNIQLNRRWRVGTTFTYSTGRPITLPELNFTHNNQLIIYYSDRNKYRLPDYHRFDVSLSFDGTLRLTKKWKSQWTLSVVNVYGRKNIYSTFYQKTQPSAANNYRQYSLYKLYIIGRPLPTLTYTFIF